MALTEKEKEYQRRYRANHKEETYGWNNTFYRNHIEERREYSKAYYIANKERILERRKRYKDSSTGMQGLVDRSLLYLLGSKLKNLRGAFGDTAYSLAHELGIQTNSIERMESGYVEKLLLYIPSILKYYGVTFEELIENY